MIHPRSPTDKALIDADNESSLTALSLRASSGVWVPNAALIIFHSPMAKKLPPSRYRSKTQKRRISIGPMFRLRCASDGVPSIGAAAAAQLHRARHPCRRACWRGAARLISHGQCGPTGPIIRHRTRSDSQSRSCGGLCDRCSEITLRLLRLPESGVPAKW